MIKWLKYSKETIFGDKTKGGLFVNFIKDFEKEFQKKVSVGCPKCLSECYNQFNKKYNRMEKSVKCDYKLYGKYNGIQIGVNGQPIRNGEMTNEIAKELLKKHPRGVLLFEVMPKEQTDQDFTLKQLRLKYPEIVANSKVKFLEKIK